MFLLHFCFADSRLFPMLTNILIKILFNFMFSKFENMKLNRMFFIFKNAITLVIAQPRTAW